MDEQYHRRHLYGLQLAARARRAGARATNPGSGTCATTPTQTPPKGRERATSRNHYTSQRYHTQYGSPGWKEEVANLLRKEGVAVVTGVFDTDSCDCIVGRVGAALEAVSPGLDLDDPSGTYRKGIVPPQPKPGLFQSLVGNLPVVWEVRSHPRVREIFAAAYSGIRRRPVDDFFVSVDGINFYPPIGPWTQPPAGGPDAAPAPDEDWAHVDACSGEMFECVQGQCVFTATTACLRASPRSHMHAKEFLEMAGELGNPGQWCLFSEEEVVQARRVVEKAGGEWQRPIESPRGSMILWLSSTVHSARRQVKGLPPPADVVMVASPTDFGAVSGLAASSGSAPARSSGGDSGDAAGGGGAGQGAGAGGGARERAMPLLKPPPRRDWTNWRCVFYVCLRPKEDMEDSARGSHARRLTRAFRDNRVTNHWGSQIFSKGSAAGVEDFGLRVALYEPGIVYDKRTADGWGLRPVATAAVLELLGATSADVEHDGDA